MTYAGFLELLAQLPFRWRLGSGGEIRSTQPPFASPLTAAGAFLRKREYQNHQWREAACDLGLSEAIAEKIHLASELTIGDGEVYEHEIRLDLLLATRIVRRQERSEASLP